MEIKPMNIVKHRKTGKEYLVLGKAKDLESGKTLCVLYCSEDEGQYLANPEDLEVVSDVIFEMGVSARDIFKEPAKA